MDLFEDLKHQEKLYQQLDRQALIKKPFSSDILTEIIHQGLFDESEKRSHYISRNHDELPIFMIYVDNSDSGIIELLKEAYHPFKQFPIKDHFFDFLLVDVEQKIIYGIGLGRRGKVFSMMSYNGKEFISSSSDIVEKFSLSMPYDLIGLIEQMLEQLGHAFFIKDNIPFDPQLLQNALHNGPEDTGEYLIKYTEDILTEEEIVNYIEEYEEAINVIGNASVFFQMIFETLSIDQLNTRDF